MPVKLLTSGGGGVNLVPSSSIASDQTMYLPTSGTSGGTVLCTDSTGGTANGVLYLNGSKQVTSGSGLVFDSSGNLLVGKTSATANGGDVQVSKGITFPATQNASSDANTLDDYEEGTWTPSIAWKNGGTAPTTASKANFTYTKIGRVVSLTGYVTFSSSGNGSSLQISGLPFAANADYNMAPLWSANGSIALTGYLPGGASYIVLGAYTGSSEGTNNANLPTEISVQMTYTTT